MNVASLITTGLYVPFMLLFAIFTIVYLIVGYKKDMGRALISLAATVVAIIGSLLLTKGLAILLASPLTVLFAALSETLPEIAQPFLQGGVEIVLSYILFWILFVTLLVVLKAISKRPGLEAKLQNLNTDTNWSRIAGSCIRGVDALLVSIMLLLPLYGGVAAVAPAVSAVMRVTMTANAAQADMGALQRGNVSSEPAPEKDILTIVDAVANHPVLALYRHGPGGWVNATLTTFTVNGKTTNVTSAADSLVGVLERTQALQEAVEAQDEQAALAASRELIAYVREDVINQRWCYNLAMTAIDELQKMVEAEVEGADRYADVDVLLDMSFEDFQATAGAVLDFTSYYLEVYSNNGGLESMDDPAVLKGLADRFDETLNQSPQTQAFNTIILQDLLGIWPEDLTALGSDALDGVDLGDVDVEDLEKIEGIENILP